MPGVFAYMGIESFRQHLGLPYEWVGAAIQ